MIKATEGCAHSVQVNCDLNMVDNILIMLHLKNIFFICFYLVVAEPLVCLLQVAWLELLNVGDVFVKHILASFYIPENI